MTGAGGRPIRDPDDLRRVMGTPYRVSDQQWAAISAPLEPAVVMAGAGSGKTSLMAARVVYLVVTGALAPGEVLGLTFTAKATAQLRQQIRVSLLDAGALGDPDALEPTVSTYNAYAAGLLVDHGLRIGFEPDTRVLADGTRFQLAARVIARHSRAVEQLSDHPATVIQAMLGLDAALAEHLVEPARVRAFDAEQRALFEAALRAEEADRNRKTYRDPPAAAMSVIDRRSELLGLVEEYREAKRAHGLIDFSDQIAAAARLAEEHPEVAAAERERFGVVLLDEYQDTSVAQARLLRALYSGADAAGGRGHPVTAVGDPNQAIYGWRGASVSNIVNFGRDFPAGDGAAQVPMYPLTVNRRSDRRILEVANELAAPLYGRVAGVRPLEAKPDAGLGEVAAVVHEHRETELRWLAQEVVAAREAMPDPSWAEIGILVRDNQHAAEVFDTLTAADVPVEIVGLNGLLRLPEVAEVVATLRLVHDVTANDALLTVLLGPRWAIGPRDLALLAARAAELAGGRRPRSADQGLVDALHAAVEQGEVSELPALCDALEDPGDLSYSAAARERFALLATELRQLRRQAGEPLLELVRRIVEVTGIDIELASAVSAAARARRDNLDLFLRAVADFQAVDGEVGLAALVGYLEAEDSLGNGLDVAVPSEADSVKLLTVHRAKGLEWDVVFVVGVGEGRFPTTRSRPLWTTAPGVLPNPLRGDAADLAVLSGHDKAALEEFRSDSRAVEADEELRLGYVAFTRARHRLWVSSYLWAERSTPFGPSPYQRTVRACMERWGTEPVSWLERPEGRTPHPFAGHRAVPWPADRSSRELRLRRDAADLVRDRAADRASDRAGTEPDELDLVAAARVAGWDEDLDRLLGELAESSTVAAAVPLPASISATSLGRLGAEADRVAAELARPMPRPPSRAARFGTRFHAWVEARFGQQQVLDPDELPGRADAGVQDEADLAELIARFEAGPFSERLPHATEAPFTVVLGGQLVRGRIDAVYAEPDGTWLVVDWKTGRSEQLDPIQLAVYRLAWAELHGLPVEQVRACFHLVRTAETIEPPDLPGRTGLEELLGRALEPEVPSDGVPDGTGASR